MLSTAGMSEREVQRIIRYRTCAECGWELVRSIENRETVIVCGRYREHHGIADSYEEKNYNIATRREFMTQEIGVEKTRALEKYGGATSLTKVEAQEIIDTIWPGASKASPAEVYKAVSICAQYGLNPLMKHLYLIPFSGKFVTVLGIGANRLIASRRHAYSYIDDTPRLMSEAEQKKIYGKVDGTNIVAVTILKDARTGATARGYGKWSIGNKVQGEDKGNSQANMAFIRSERQALDRLYPAELPDAPVLDEQFMNGKVEATVEAQEEAPQVAEPATEVSDAPPEEQPSQAATATPDTNGKNEKPVDLSALKFATAGEFMKACKEHFGLMPSDVSREVSMYDCKIAGQREQAWMQLVGAYGKK